MAACRQTKTELRLYRQLRRTSENFSLLSAGDRIMVCVSGGKDSYTLLKLLRFQAARLPFPIELVAVHLDQQQPGYDGAPLVQWLDGEGVDYEILSEDTYSVVVDKLDEKSTYCSLCSRLRRGILYSAAERLGCNKLALGHHRDDSLETFLMNLFYSGRMQAMPAQYTTDDGKFQVIRPMIEIAEKDIETYAAEQDFPILPCNLCGSQDGLKRDAMTELLSTLEKDNPHLRTVMLSALRNVRPTHLLDQEVLAAWQDRDPGIRPNPPAKETAKNAAALPIRQRRLPVLG